MTETVILPVGTRVKNTSAGKVEILQETIEVQANWRSDDDTWVFAHKGFIYEVKLHPGD